MLTGRKPYTADTPAAVLIKVTNECGKPTFSQEESSNPASCIMPVRFSAMLARKLPNGAMSQMSFLELVSIVVREYDPAISFFVDILGFELVEDSPSQTTDGHPKRWVVVRPPGGQTGLLLARADGDRQAAVVGNQQAGRVGFFLRVEDFASRYERMLAAGVEFVRPPRREAYGQVAVFLDIAGNRWDLLGP